MHTVNREQFWYVFQRRLNASGFQSELATRNSVYRANREGLAKPRPEDGDAIRRGKANANRIFTPLKAALNRAFNDGRVPDDTAW